MQDSIDGVVIVPAPSQEWLGERQVVDYRQHRTELIRWALNVGKSPEKGEGYAQATVKQRGYRLDKFYRWVWTEEDRYTTEITTSHADGFLKELAYTDHTTTYKAGMQKAIKMLFKWRRHAAGEDVDWEPPLNFSSNTSASQPKDFFTRDERKRLREAALSYGSLPTYQNLTAAERNEWTAYLAQYLQKPKEEVSPDDWDRAQSWKVPSLVWTALDVGLRPVEVGRAVVSWVDTENEVLRIPKEDSSKNRENWVVGLQSRTATALDRWMAEREQFDRYDGTDALWLTREGNPYSSHSLNYLLDRLCEEADIPVEDREVSWYSIRHSVGTYMTREEDLAAAQAQLRHKSEQTTMKYDQAPVEDRKGALERMG